MKDKKCIICGFDKRIEKHHLIKVKEGGSNEENNLVLLCPNHHWIADFGSDKDRIELLKIIKELTAKEGSYLSNENLDILDKKIFALASVVWGNMDDKFKIEYRETSNYTSVRSWLLGRGCSKEDCIGLNERAEKLLLINKLKESLPNV